MWHAYVSVRTNTESGRKLTKGKSAARQTLLDTQPAAHKQLLEFSFHGCRALADNHPRICRRLRRGEETTVIGKAGHLVAGFRDYLFHGHDRAPELDDLPKSLSQELQLSPERSVQSARMIGFARLTVHMLQALLHAELAADVSVPADDVGFLSAISDTDCEIPCRFALNLATFWPDADQPRLDESEIEFLADGCDVTADTRRSLSAGGL